MNFFSKLSKQSYIKDYAPRLIKRFFLRIDRCDR